MPTISIFHKSSIYPFVALFDFWILFIFSPVYLLTGNFNSNYFAHTRCRCGGHRPHRTQGHWHRWYAVPSLFYAHFPLPLPPEPKHRYRYRYTGTGTPVLPRVCAYRREPTSRHTHYRYCYWAIDWLLAIGSLSLMIIVSPGAPADR
jgi:hypothetical protein